MSAVEDDFNRRCEEIDTYIAYLKRLEGDVGLDVSLMATMKASSLLMIYNLMESTMTNAIESIFDHLRAEKLGFVVVDDQLKAMVLKCAKETNPKDLVKKMRDEMLDLAVAAFRRDGVFSGNVDSRKIREVWDNYGISRSGSYSEKALVEIKGARNDLAHGAKSFSELGKDQTASELEKKYKAVRALLLRAVKDVELHIANKLKASLVA
ncbi:MAE_28990/MAE_18760 family HEPN-like nuclease [Dyella sp.]|uniref:MAE_28990/MAE_18760 family HEPN-like nuclease n=1 Tax=Dyella sp. TaxID=1869338 RepID=UPI003F7DE6E2